MDPVEKKIDVEEPSTSDSHPKFEYPSIAEITENGMTKEDPPLDSTTKGEDEAESTAKRKCPFVSNGSSHSSNASDLQIDISDSESEDDKNSNPASLLSSEEIDAMLDEGLQDAFKKTKRRKVKENEGEKAGSDKDDTFEERERVVVIEKGHNHFDVLPEGWLQVTHNSGMPVYLHKTARVCTLSKPYYLGPGSARKHKIPLIAIPCLNYKRALEKEAELEKENEEQLKEQSEQELNGNPPKLWLPNARIETVQENLAVQSLDVDEFREYCQKVFKFKTIKVMRFKSWPARRKYTKRTMNERQLNRPTLPDGTKLITLPVFNSEKKNSSNSFRKEWIMNPNGKSFVCILHEYVQHALKKQPSYEFKESENASMPYSATVTINDMKYGTGYGTSKKQAKSHAARNTLEILIPQMKTKILAESGEDASTAGKVADHDLSFFDDIKIEDRRVAEFCQKTTEPSPHAILLICLQRNFGLTDMQIEYHGNTLKHQKNLFTMTVGSYTATVTCKNKRDGKQLAAQVILQALHPHLTSWGSLLRLYGNRSVQTFREKKQEEQEITQLQSKAAVNSPNYAILQKLRTEMGKLKDKHQKKSIGSLMTFEPYKDTAEYKDFDKIAPRMSSVSTITLMSSDIPSTSTLT